MWLLPGYRLNLKKALILFVEGTIRKTEDVMLLFETTLEEECRELRESLRDALDRQPDGNAQAAGAYLLDHLAEHYPAQQARLTAA
jgi:hypothetical protein